MAWHWRRELFGRQAKRGFELREERVAGIFEIRDFRREPVLLDLGTENVLQCDFA